MLHNKHVGSVVHFSLVAYVFMYLKGKMQLTSKVKALLQDQELDPNAENRILESVQVLSDIVHFVGKATKGGQLPLERKGAKDKLVWNWTDPIYGTYKRLMGEIVQYNHNISRAPLQRKDKFVFYDLTEKTLADYAERKQHRESSEQRNMSLEELGESVIPVVDLRFQEYDSGSGGGHNQSHLSTASPGTWVPKFN